MHNTLTLGYTNETEDCKKNFFWAAKNGGYTPGGLYIRHYSMIMTLTLDHHLPVPNDDYFLRHLCLSFSGTFHHLVIMTILLKGLKVIAERVRNGISKSEPQSLVFHGRKLYKRDWSETEEIRWIRKSERKEREDKKKKIPKTMKGRS